MYRLFLALRYLRSRFVNLISVGGVMFGVAVLIAVVSIMDGFQDQVRTTVRGNLSHLIMIPAPQPDAAEGWLIPFEKLERELLALDDRIVAVAPQISMPIAYPYRTRRRSWLKGQNKALHQMQAIGIDWKREIAVSRIADNLKAGDRKNPFFNERAYDREITTVLIGRTFAERFFGLTELDFDAYVSGRLRHPVRTPQGKEPTIDDLGKGDPRNRIEITYATVTEKDGEYTLKPNNTIPMVTGIVDGRDSAMDSRTMYFEIAKLRELGGFDEEYLEVRVKLNDYEHAEAVRTKIDKAYPNYAVETWEDQKREFLQAVEYEKIMLVVILSFIVLLGGFIILATLTLTVVEKTRDIGILGALGATRSGILAVFLWNGLLIGLIGSLLGLGLGYWFVDNVDLVRAGITNMTGRDPFPANIYHFREVPTIWHWPTVLTIMGGSVLVSFLAALLPALRAARLDPIKALRHE